MHTEDGGPHLFGLAKIEDADTLRQMLGGWYPGMDEIQPRRTLAGVDAHGQGWSCDDTHDQFNLLAYPVHVVVPITLPAHQVKPPSAARPYRR